ncbi:tripartite tricarboxylate transporter substrate binding protein [Hydrogenophaga sp.]|uniref:Bug family tripartite tricarboxylate transporter substrate binding protein n=1 Tax=Hydrogenophaga sp. TaxID=1904254 RepID=UPI002717F809|nr:tripartite tricarboxylate transporter substrate-binding protein [Hydrogenophaga sp.]MDO9434394.1 tripartite tricarboxylate transporter substrate-binding protein [Hydrogenophaga sp.]
MNFRRVFCTAALIAALPFASAQAQNRIVRVIVPYAPGGNIDVIARTFSKELGELMEETWIVENVPGANGAIGTERVARSAPNGTTLLFSADVHSMLPLVVKKVPYDPIKDFTPVALVAKAPLLFVVNAQKVKANDLKELVTEIQAAPANFTFAISGAGSSPQLAAEMFKVRTKLDLMSVNYKGTGPAVTDVAAGHVTMMAVTPLAALNLARAGKLKALAVTSPTRFEGAPEIPTTAEAGMPGYEVLNSYGFWGPANLPADQLARLSEAMRKTAQSAKMKQRLLELGVMSTWESPKDFEKHIVTEFDRNRKIYEGAGIKPE